MGSSPRTRMVALGIAVPALAIWTFGEVGFLDAVFSPFACGIVCASPPWRSLGPSLEILGFGAALFAFVTLLQPGIFDGRRELVGTGLLFIVLGSVVFEGIVAALFADFFLGPWGGNTSYNSFAALMTATLGTVGLALPLVGARHWWIAGEPRGGSGIGSSSESKSMIREGALLLILGAAGAILAVEFASCIASWVTCKPYPLVPLELPLLVFAVGAGLITAVVWRSGAKPR